MNFPRVLLALVFSLPYAAQAESGVADFETSDDSEKRSPQIVGGTEVATCGFPSVVSIDFGSCTGTLIHPRVVVTAAHCGSPSTISFGETPGNGFGVQTQDCMVVPGQGRGADVQFCVLAEAVTSIPSTPVLYGCETDLLQPNAPVTLVGFGLTSFNNQGSGGIKRWVNTIFKGTLPEGSALVGTPEASPCPGDSGGPAFVRLADGSLRTFGVVSGGTTGIPCNGDAAYPMVDQYVPWFEETTGIDITPCHDADGTWNPSAECTGFYAGDHSGAGTWAAMCAGSSTSEAGTSCGANPMDEGDPGDPQEPPNNEGPGDADSGGCQSGGAAGGIGWSFTLLGLLVGLRRRVALGFRRSAY